MKTEARLVITLITGIAVALVMTVVSAVVTSKRNLAERPDPASVALPVFQ